MGGIPRLAVAVALLAALGAAAFLLAPEPTPGEAGTVQVIVETPDGVLWDGPVTLDGDHADALSALLLAADTGGFEVDVQHFAGYAPCGDYVRRIDAWAETATEGWVYEVYPAGADDKTWQHPPVGACAYGLHDGDAVRWRFGVE